MKNRNNSRNRTGIVLLLTLVILVVISMLAYTLSSRVAAQRHRDRYIIDYSKARYGCDSAIKYALATLEDINPQLIIRPDEPDFSDLFWLDELEYQELLAELADKMAFDTSENYNDISDINNISEINDIDDINDINDSDIEDFNDITDFNSINEPNDTDSLVIRGPYGPAWPFVTEPVEFEIGSATVRIEIEDENAKYPTAWALLDDRAAQAGLEIFCEWMNITPEQIEALKSQFEQISQIKPFRLDLEPITITERKPVSRRTVVRRGKRITTSRRPSKKKAIPVSVQIADFAKLFHTSLIDTEVLARPTIISDSRKESALKYMGMWASKQVNINTAPRQVLEAAFVFGGDEVGIAEEIIKRRRIKPFESVAELRQSLLKYSDSIRNCEKYITTVSKFFTIKVTAVSGLAKVSSIIAVTKDGGKIERIAVISG